MFESDAVEDPRLPSPNQLRGRILIKNKKLKTSVIPAIQLKGSKTCEPSATRRGQPNRTNSLLSVTRSVIHESRA